MIERQYRIGNSRKRLMEVLSLLSSFLIAPEDDYVLEIRPARKEKSHDQRKLFHALCTQAGKELGHTPGQVKAMVKEEHFGLDTIKAKSGKTYTVVQSSEDADRYEYSELIETLLRWSSENGVLLDTRQAA
jgi:hypothetical protein